MLTRSAYKGSGEGVIHNLLRFRHDRVQVGLVLKALRVDLIDILGSRGPRREPATGRDNLQAANRFVIAGRARKLRDDRLSRQSPPP